MVAIHCHTLQPITTIDLVTTMPTKEIMSPGGGPHMDAWRQAWYLS
jgi:hypothetical protein